jgi:hypothetical protein
LVTANRDAERTVGHRIDDYLNLPLQSEGKLMDTMPAMRAALHERHAKTLGFHTTAVRFGLSDVYAVKALPLEHSCVALVFHNVTHSATARRRLATAESTLAQVCRSARAILWTANPATLECRSVTPEANTVLGY